MGAGILDAAYPLGPSGIDRRPCKKRGRRSSDQSKSKEIATLIGLMMINIFINKMYLQICLKISTNIEGLEHRALPGVAVLPVYQCALNWNTFNWNINTSGMSPSYDSGRDERNVRCAGSR